MPRNSLPDKCVSTRTLRSLLSIISCLLHQSTDDEGLCKWRRESCIGIADSPPHDWVGNQTPTSSGDCQLCTVLWRLLGVCFGKLSTHAWAAGLRCFGRVRWPSLAFPTACYRFVHKWLRTSKTSSRNNFFSFKVCTLSLRLTTQD